MERYCSPAGHRTTRGRPGPKSLIHKAASDGVTVCYIGGMVDFCPRTLISRVAGLLLLLGSTMALAQNGPPVMPQFEADAPKVGEPLPDVTIFDDLGNPVNLRELADENYKVLVLGCLT